MAFSVSLSEDSGKVRLLIRDTDTATAANQIFTDAEITAFLAIDASVYGAAALALRSMAADASRCAVAYKLLRNNVEIDRRDLPKRFLEIAKTYIEERDTSGGSQLRPIMWELNSVGIDETDYPDSYDDQDSYFVDDFETHGEV